MSRDPDAIVREIEQTRAELADTIDAIAKRANPKAAASRGADAVKAQVAAAKNKIAPDTAGSTGDGSEVTPSATALPVKPIAGAVAAIIVVLAILRWLRSRS